MRLGSVPSLGTATELVLQVTNTPVTTHIDFTGKSSHTHVEPVSVLRSELASDTSLDVSTPLGDLDLIVLLQVLGVSMDEVLSWDILFYISKKR